METRRRSRPKWKHRPAASAETGDVRGPPSYDLRRFHGQVESAEAQVAFRLVCETVRPLSQPTCAIPLFGSRCDGETRSRPGTNSLAAGGDYSIQHDLGEN